MRFITEPGATRDIPPDDVWVIPPEGFKTAPWADRRWFVATYYFRNALHYSRRVKITFYVSGDTRVDVLKFPKGVLPSETIVEEQTITTTTTFERETEPTDVVEPRVLLGPSPQLSRIEIEYAEGAPPPPPIPKKNVWVECAGFTKYSDLDGCMRAAKEQTEAEAVTITWTFGEEGPCGSEYSDPRRAIEIAKRYFSTVFWVGTMGQFDRHDFPPIEGVLRGLDEPVDMFSYPKAWVKKFWGRASARGYTKELIAKFIDKWHGKGWKVYIEVCSERELNVVEEVLQEGHVPDWLIVHYHSFRHDQSFAERFEVFKHMVDRGRALADAHDMHYMVTIQTFGGGEAWRFPTLEELKTEVNYAKPKCDCLGFHGFPSHKDIWSSDCAHTSELDEHPEHLSYVKSL